MFKRNPKVAKKTIPKLKLGIPSFDKILYGGLYQGTVNLIEEDPMSKHFYSFIRCFLGEGAQNKELLFVYSDLPSQNLVPPVGKMPKQADAKMRIAWRYAKTSVDDSESGSNVYDLSKSCNYPVKFGNNRAEELYNAIYSDVERSIESSDDGKVRRIFIRLDLNDWDLRKLNSFMVSIKTLVRSLNGVCLISANLSAAGKELGFICEKHSDLVMAMKDFPENNPFIGFCGTLEIKKNVSLQSLANYDFPTFVFGLVRDNKFLTIENLSLPPADSENNTKILDY